ncbi:alternative ribosome rescue aminoacyl-tRNA hydrolase ArfB [Kineosporia sp. R_H_3]|uniref:alternative ribosome rescue aminoacyl-tRNA hydrolase ArfB n=1 Tax=Kineosporia sp. R_H_3 TaxID=1961848 RepID=UPI000B4AE654
MDADLVVTPAVRIPADELRWRFSRSSGPGGQGVNTTDSRVELGWDAPASVALHGLGEGVRERALERLAARSVDGVVTIAASQFRSQLRNREAARARLAALVREAVAPPPAARRRTRPTRGSQLRRLEGKKRRSQVKRLRRGEE